MEAPTPCSSGSPCAGQLTTLAAWRSLCPPEGMTLTEYMRRFEATLRLVEPMGESTLPALVQAEYARCLSLHFRGLLRGVEGSERLVPLSGWGTARQSPAPSSAGMSTTKLQEKR